MASEDPIKERYGEISMESGPVDPENPTFASLLGALKAVATGEMEMDVLIKYHDGLSMQLDDSRESIENMPIPEEFKEIATENKNVAIGSLDIIQIMLDLLEKYIQEPSKENLGACVDSLLNCQSVMRDMNTMLDQNIKFSQLKGEE
jgi:hypothetical protein